MKISRHIRVLFCILFLHAKIFSQCSLAAAANYSFDCLTSTAVASLTIIGSSGPFTITSSPPAINSTTTSNLAQGVYNITITISPTCSTFVQLTINNPYNPGNLVFTNTNVTCYGGNDGASIATFQNSNGPPFSYTWTSGGSPGQSTQTAVNLTAGIYSVTVKDSQGCTVSNSVNITQPPDIQTFFSNTMTTCFGGTLNTAVTTTGGNPAFTYSINGAALTGTLANGILAGTHTVITKDSKGCLKTNTLQINQPPQPLISYSITAPLCPGSSNGSATVTVSSAPLPYSYTWQPVSGFTNSLGGISAGNYTVLVKDASSCITKSVVVVVPAVNINVTVNIKPENCSAADGTATLNVTGGNFPYTFTTIPIGSHPSNVLTNLSSGSYTTFIKDANGCVDSLVYMVGNLSTVSVSVSSFTPVLCYNQCSGAVVLSVQNAVSPVTYSASGSPTTSSNVISNMCAGYHIIRVVDGIGCPATTTINFPAPAAFSYSASAPSAICFGNNITMNAIASGGSPGPYNYIWNPGNISGQLVTTSPAATTVYSLNVYDANNCTLPPYIFTVNVAPPLSININSSATGICPGTTAQITPTITGGDGNYIYDWQPGNTTSSTLYVQNIEIPTYTLFVKDGCGSPTAVRIVTINLFPVIVPQFSTSASSGCEPFCTQFINTTPKSGGAIWNYGDKPFEQAGNTTSYCYQKAGTYNLKVTVIDSNSCKAAHTYSNAIHVLQAPRADFITTPKIITLNNSENVLIENTTANGSTYEWFKEGVFISSANNITYSFSDTGCTRFKLIARNENNCSDTIQKNVCVIEGFNFWIPDCFTPDNDNLNETFIPKGTAWVEKNYLFEVFNRWGTRIFHTNDSTQGWTGKASENISDPSDVYLWRVSVTDNLDIAHEMKGFVLLLK
ncbi:MAG: hypothetical protein JWO32_1760 [Bacteroidetes bacterium]|nr:hypothetical protein [Bacteroidota bacterium]